MTKLALISYCSNSLSMVLESILALELNYSIDICYLHDDTISMGELSIGNKISNYDFNIKRIMNIEEFQKYDKLFVCNMNGKIRNELLNKISVKEQQKISFVHPEAYISSSAKIGYNCYIGPMCCVDVFSEIGDGVFMNRAVTIGHHTKILDFCTLNPACNIAGNCIIGTHSTISIAANIIDNIIIGSNTVIGAGSVVTKITPSNVIAYGVPSKIIKKNGAV